MKRKMPDSFRRAKIVCTLGPATQSEKMIRKLISAGMDVARINFSHGEAEEHVQTVRAIRKCADSLGRPVGILQDLQGPKLRIGTLSEPRNLERGDIITLTCDSSRTDAIPVSYRKLAQEVNRGEPILLDDGRIELVVESKRKHDIRCRVVTGGTLTSKKGINLPGTVLSLPSLTSKDRKDLELGLQLDVDFVALSFVRSAQDLVALSRAIRKANSKAQIIAKMEKPQAVDNLREILDSAYGIMVARGDLGVELPPERVPLLQKRMIRAGRVTGKPVITATQMLESMVSAPRPTRAEASDVANAILDGTDAVMLSAETAVGQYPVEAVEVMDRIIRTTEASTAYRICSRRWAEERSEHDVASAVGKAAAETAHITRAKFITVFTQTGSTATLVSRYRPSTPIWAFTPNLQVQRQLSLVWGLQADTLRIVGTTDNMITSVAARLKRNRLVKKGDLIVITAGSPGKPGTTDLMKVHRIE